MCCNSQIHDELKNTKEFACHFCDEQLEDVVVSDEPCCENMDLIKDNGANVCCYCGSVHNYDAVNEYLDFHDNLFKIRRKSVYHRKYHIINRIDNVSIKNGVSISFKNKEKIIKVFQVIDKILPQINGDRKRMICINYALIKLFKMLGLSYKNISISKSKKTLAFYNKYWRDVLSLVGDDIELIITK